MLSLRSISLSLRVGSKAGSLVMSVAKETFFLVFLGVSLGEERLFVDLRFVVGVEHAATVEEDLEGDANGDIGLKVVGGDTQFDG